MIQNDPDLNKQLNYQPGLFLFVYLSQYFLLLLPSSPLLRRYVAAIAETIAAWLCTYYLFISKCIFIFQCHAHFQWNIFLLESVF